MTNQHDGGRRVRILGELPRDIAPPKDLWPAIEAAIARPEPAARPAPVRRRPPAAWLAAAAMLACVGIGVWAGRGLLPRGGTEPATAARTASPHAADPGAAAARDAAYVSDPRYAQQRAALLKSLQAQLATLPAPTQAKVAASLAAVQKAKQDLEQALGHDPGNALLQELLINTYQDEMRVLTDVHEASGAGRGI